MIIHGAAIFDYLKVECRNILIDMPSAKGFQKLLLCLKKFPAFILVENFGPNVQNSVLVPFLLDVNYLCTGKIYLIESSKKIF
jgi:hypothetical protein